MSNSYYSRKLIPTLLVIFFVILATAHVMAVLLSNESGILYEFSKNFDLDRERNIPTMYSGFLHAMIAFCAVYLATRKIIWQNKVVYFVLAALFFYIAFDETLVIHELFADPVRNLLNIESNNPLYHAWVIPAAAVIVFLLAMLLLLRGKNTESHFQRRIIAYLALLGIGIVSLEIIGTQLYFSETVYKLGPVMIEELLEIGMVSFILYIFVKRLDELVH